MKIARVVFVLFLALIPLSRVFADNAPAAAMPKEEETLFMAKKALEDGFYDVSLGLLERFLNDYPDSPSAAEADLLTGECLFRQNRFTDALSKFEGLLKEERSKNIKDALYYWIAEVNFKENNFTQAFGYYNNIIREFPASSYAPIAYYSLGWCLFQEQRFKAAMEYFEVLAQKYPNEPQSKDASFKILECLYNLKDYALLKGRISSSIAGLSKDAWRLPYLYFYLGEANYYLGDLGAAIEAYSKVLTHNPDEKMRALSRLDLAWSYLKLKRYKEAQDFFWSIKQDNLERKGRDVLLLGKAMLSMETNRLNEAKRLYEQLLAVANDPLILAQASIGRADTLYSLADYPEASKAYRQALAKINFKEMPAPTVDKLHYSLGWSLFKQRDLKEAIQEFQKVVDSGIDLEFKLSALCQIGDAYQAGSDFKKAEEAYSYLLKEYPGSSYNDYALYQLGSVFLKDSKINEAILNLRALLKNFPSSQFLDDAAYTLGLAYFKAQDYNSAKIILSRFQTEFKDSDLRSEAYYLLGNCLYSLGDYAAAIRVFKDVPRFILADDNELAQKAEYGIASSLYQSGKEKEALARFNTLRSKYPDSNFAPEVIWWLGSYYYQHNEPGLAARYFLSLIQDFPKSRLLADAYYALGLVFTQESRPLEALDNFKKAAALNKPDVKSKAVLAIADIFSSTGDYDDALDYYRKGLDAASLKDAPGLRLKIAEIQEAKGNLEEAIKEYLEAVKLSGKDSALTAQALFRLGQIYEDKNNPGEALNIYTRILDMNTPESKFAQERINRIKGKSH